MKVTKEQVSRFKELNQLIKSKKATRDEVAEAKKLASMMKSKPDKNFNRYGKKVESATNEISWYTKYPELFKDSANVIFNEIAGTRFGLIAPGTSGVSSLTWPIVGARVEFIPTIGKSGSPNDAYNYQMRNLWLQLHRAFRGIGTYEYPDLGIAIFAIVCLFGEVARAERIYGMLNRFDPMNRSFPKTLAKAAGLDPTVIDASELADFRYQLNRIIAKMALLCLPKGMSIFEQYISLYGGVFKDADNPRAQWFLYDSPFICKYSAGSLSTGGAVAYVTRTKTSNGRQSLQDIITDLNVAADLLLNDTDIARMCSDILKAFGDNGIERLAPIPEDFIIVPINDPIRKLQLHNTVFAGTVAGGNFSSTIMGELSTGKPACDYLCVYQEDGFIKQELFTVTRDFGYSSIEGATNGFKYGVGAGSLYVPGSNSTNIERTFFPSSPIIDTWEDVVGPEAVVEMTRQTLAYNFRTDGPSGYVNVYELSSFSTYVVLGMVFYRSGAEGSFNDEIGVRANFNHIANLNMFGDIVSCISVLDWHPLLAAVHGSLPVVVSCIYDIDNYSLISKEALNRLHETCTLSLVKLDLVSSSGTRD